MKKSKKNKKSTFTCFYIAMIMSYLYLFGVLIYKYVSTRDITDCILEIIFIVIISVLIGLSILDFKDKKKICLRSKIVKKAKKYRVRIYFAEGIFFSICATALSFVLINLNIWSINFYSLISNNAVLAIFIFLFGLLIGFFMLGFIIDYIFSEYVVKNSKRLV